MPRLKEKYFNAQVLRRRGLSLNEISESLGVSKSTVSLWLRNFKLSGSAIQRLAMRITKGQINSARNRKARTDASRLDYFNRGLKSIEEAGPILFRNKTITKILCALLYYCEGAKLDGEIQFTNSDPNLVRVFLKLFRGSFILSESKFRVSLHLHSYHNPSKEIRFWSIITRIPSSQFFRPYLKANSGKNMKIDYRGCVNIKYYDTKLARELLGIGKAFINKYK